MHFLAVKGLFIFCSSIMGVGGGYILCPSGRDVNNTDNAALIQKISSTSYGEILRDNRDLESNGDLDPAEEENGAWSGGEITSDKNEDRGSNVQTTIEAQSGDPEITSMISIPTAINENDSTSTVDELGLVEEPNLSEKNIGEKSINQSPTEEKNNSDQKSSTMVPNELGQDGAETHQDTRKLGNSNQGQETNQSLTNNQEIIPGQSPEIGEIPKVKSDKSSYSGTVGDSVKTPHENKPDPEITTKESKCGSMTKGEGANSSEKLSPTRPNVNEDKTSALPNPAGQMQETNNKSLDISNLAQPSKEKSSQDQLPKEIKVTLPAPEKKSITTPAKPVTYKKRGNQISPNIRSMIRGFFSGNSGPSRSRESRSQPWSRPNNKYNTFMV